MTFARPKKKGGLRHISAPQGMLKHIQQQLAALLSGIYNDLEQSRATGRLHEEGDAQCVLAHGFKQGFDITTNADVHRGRRFVFNTDIENFFPSINFGRVRGFLILDRNFQLSPTVATIIAQIACYKNELPQGAPCSPVISNLIAHTLDIKLNKLATRHNCSYSRYADDLTFSTNERAFPSDIARLVGGTKSGWVAGNGLLSRVYASGFRINHDKSRMQLDNARQMATGIIVNRQLNVPAEYYKTARAMCDRLFRDGYCHQGKQGDWKEYPPHKLQGRMDFIRYVRRSRVRPKMGNPTPKERQKAYIDRENAFRLQQPKFTTLYRDLLNHQSFHAIRRPVIVGEGPTDALYMNAAIRSIGPLFANLYDAKLENPVLVDFYKHTDTRKIYQIGDGASHLREFCKEYKKLMEPFQLIPQHPVIVVVDSDGEGRGVLNAVGQRYGQKITTADSFCHLIGNLYITSVPPNGASDTVIEDLFDPTDLARDLNGRTFTKKNDYDSTVNYGKADFAGKVVRPLREQFKWDGFDPLLKRLEEIIVDYQKRLAPIPAGAAAAP